MKLSMTEMLAIQMVNTKVQEAENQRQGLYREIEKRLGIEPGGLGRFSLEADGNLAEMRKAEKQAKATVPIKSRAKGNGAEKAI